jgi:hypothetical protein
MSAALSIYSTQAAPSPLARWLQRLLLPVLNACLFTRALPRRFCVDHNGLFRSVALLQLHQILIFGC